MTKHNIKSINILITDFEGKKIIFPLESFHIDVPNPEILHGRFGQVEKPLPTKLTAYLPYDLDKDL